MSEDQDIREILKQEHDKTFAAGMVVGCLGLALLLIIVMALAGCTSPAQKVLRSVNDYEYRNARYVEECKVPAPKCPEKAALLREWSKALDEAGAALKRGGSFPLQLQRLADTEKSYPN